jgi:hypothetical protein
VELFSAVVSKSEADFSQNINSRPGTIDAINFISSRTRLKINLLSRFNNILDKEHSIL